ncbi:MAG TPA: hypothetical protein VNZ54_09875 [bacterium]|jgi:hypothetical protein|nr:hypothetical protein [bacterium]
MKRLGGLLCLLAVAAAASGHRMDWEDYGPFGPEETVGHPLTRTVAVQVKEKLMPCDVPGQVQEPYPRFVLDMKTEKGGEDSFGQKGLLRLETKRGKVAFTLPLNGDLEIAWSEAVSADLNNDGAPDYLLRAVRSLKTSDNPVQETLVFLSGPRGYAAWEIQADAEADYSDLLVRLKGNPGVFLLWSASIRDHGGQKVDVGDYLVNLYHLIGFQGQEPVLADDVDARFPMFISRFYNSRRQNHRETALLEPVQKKKLLALHRPSWSALALRKRAAHPIL